MIPTIETVYPSPGYSFFFQSAQKKQLHFNWHTHLEYELLLCSSGGGQAHIGDMVDSFEGPAAYLIGSMVPHGFSGDRSCKGCLVQIPPHCFAGIEERPEFSSLNVLLTRADKGIRFSKPTTQHMSLIIEEADKRSCLHLWLSILEALETGAHDSEARTCSAVSSADTQEAKMDTLETLLHRIFNEASKPQHLAEAAEALDVSVPSFCRIFKKRTGMSFIEYLHSTRINSAKIMLLQTRLYIINICYQCGFNNVSFFNRKFKEQTGMTPTEYRKQYSSLFTA